MPLDDALAQRIRILLGVHGESSAAAVEPDPSASSLGADGALAFGWPDGTVGTAYAFPTLVAARAAQERLGEPAMRSTRSSVNGGLLLYVSGPDTEERAARARSLIARWAGRE